MEALWESLVNEGKNTVVFSSDYASLRNEFVWWLDDKGIDYATFGIIVAFNSHKIVFKEGDKC